MLTYKADIRFCFKQGNAPMILLTWVGRIGSALRNPWLETSELRQKSAPKIPYMSGLDIK